MKGAICNRLFQISSKTRTIEIDGSIVRRYASDTERDRESYTDVCGVAGWQQPKRLGINPTSNCFDEAHDVLLDEAELVARLDHQPAKHPPTDPSPLPPLKNRIPRLSDRTHSSRRIVCIHPAA